MTKGRFSTDSITAVTTGNTFQDLPQLLEIADNIERYA
jgi:hypothetical protein